MIGLKQEHFSKRYIVKISSSIILAVLNGIIQIILPRVLTVEEYGIYSYNLNVFVSVVTLANLSTSGALVSKFSKRNNEVGLVRFYWKYIVIEFVVLTVGTILLFNLGILDKSLGGQTLFLVILGLEAAFVNKLLSDVIGLYDAMSVAQFPALMQVLLKVLVCIFVFVINVLGKINLVYFYIGQIILTIFVVAILIVEWKKYQDSLYKEKIDLGAKAYIKEYYVYCRPLILSTVVSQLMVVIMNWALMRWSGSTEQAMFGVVWQINSLIAYVFAPYAELSKKEFAVKCDEEEQLERFYIKSYRIMFWITGYFTVYIAFFSKEVLSLLYGDKYQGAVIVNAMIMAYTLFQALGQINGSFYMATERTQISAIISILGQVIMAILTFIFQIPNMIFPNGLGAIGIALVYMIGNILITEISVAVAAKIIKIRLFDLLKYQFVTIFLLIMICYIIKLVISIFINNFNICNSLLIVLISGGIYTVILALLVLKNPKWFGIGVDIKGRIKGYLSNEKK